MEPDHKSCDARTPMLYFFIENSDFRVNTATGSRPFIPNNFMMINLPLESKAKFW